MSNMVTTPKEKAKQVSMESHDFSPIRRCVNFALIVALFAMGAGIAQAGDVNLRVLLSIGLFLIIGVLLFMLTTPLKVLEKKESERSGFLQGFHQEKRKLLNKIEDLSATQTELNDANTNLHQAFDSIQQYGDEAKARASELEDLTNSLSLMTEESDTIFNSVNSGLCLIDESYKIGQRVSLAMYEIFETENIKGLSFLDLMRPLITEKDLKTLETFLALQFKKKTSPKQLEKFNPLKQIEITLNWDGNRFTHKHLAFSFQRVMDGDKIAATLVTVTDISSSVVLENKLKASKEQQDRRTELMLEVVQGDHESLQVFMDDTESKLEEINAKLKEHGVKEDLEIKGASNQEIIEFLFREVHTIKGNASLLGLESIVGIAHSVETKLNELKVKDVIKGDEYLGALMQLATLKERLQEYREISDTVRSSFTAATGPKLIATPSSALAGELDGFTRKVSEDLEKSVYVRSDFNVDDVSDHGLSVIKDVFIQAIRNSLVHGIEAKEERLRRGKLEKGQITLMCKVSEVASEVLSEPGYELTFRDDGGGLDITKIASLALERGMITEADANTMPASGFANLVFSSGFSVATELSDHGGRGVGLDVVKDIIVNELGGKISVKFLKGFYFQVSCFVPVRNLNAEQNQARTA